MQFPAGQRASDCHTPSGSSALMPGPGLIGAGSPPWQRLGPLDLNISDAMIRTTEHADTLARRKHLALCPGGWAAPH
jgi:hypothetical protein